MAKPGASKKNREPSKHSRAARRATSIDIDTDKSLKDVQLPTESSDYRPAVLHNHHGAGVTKKSKRGRKAVLTSKARKRKDKDADRAEAIMERTANKIEKSKGQGRSVQARRKDWEDINSIIPEQQRKFPTEEDIVDNGDVPVSASGAQAQGQDDGKDWETDEEMDGADAGGAGAPTKSAVPKVDENDDEIL